jgi:hypothetical protein
MCSPYTRAKGNYEIQARPGFKQKGLTIYHQRFSAPKDLIYKLVNIWWIVTWWDRLPFDKYQPDDTSSLSYAWHSMTYKHGKMVLRWLLKWPLAYPISYIDNFFLIIINFIGFYKIQNHWMQAQFWTVIPFRNCTQFFQVLECIWYLDVRYSNVHCPSNQNNG